MDQDPRFVYFRLIADDGGEPHGASGAALIPGRSLAVDPAHHPDFELLWIDARGGSLAGARPAYQRLAVALDRGGAITGPVRADLYVGGGPVAGDEAAQDSPHPAPLPHRSDPAMNRDPDVEDLRLWAVVSSTVRPLRPSSLALAGRDARKARRVGESEAATAATKPKPAAKQPHPVAARPALPTRGRRARGFPPTSIRTCAAASRGAARLWRRGSTCTA